MKIDVSRSIPYCSRDSGSSESINVHWNRYVKGTKVPSVVGAVSREEESSGDTCSVYVELSQGEEGESDGERESLIGKSTADGRRAVKAPPELSQ